MTDKNFIKLLEQVRKETLKRTGKVCPELEGNCFGCKSHIMVAYINEWIDVLEYKEAKIYVNKIKK